MTVAVCHRFIPLKIEFMSLRWVFSRLEYLHSAFSFVVIFRINEVVSNGKIVWFTG